MAARESARRVRSRRNGEGTIRQRKDGRFEARIWVPTTAGGEERKSIYGSSWDAVNDELIRLKADTLAGVRQNSAKDSVSEYMAYWLANVVQERVRPSTFSSYSWITNSYVLPYLGRKKLGKLNAPELRTFLNRLKKVCQCCALDKDAKRKKARCCAVTPRRCCESFVSDGTIRYVHRLLRAALQDAVIDGLLVTNPARNLRLPHRYRPKVEALSADEATTLLRVAKDGRLYALYALVLTLGLRRGEVLALRWTDVDFGNGVLYVRRTLSRVDGTLRFGPVKTRDSERAVALPEPCMAALRGHRLRQADEREAAGDRWCDTGLIFTSTLGTPMEPRNLYRHFHELCDRAEVRRVRFHDLRHSCATLLYEQGVPLDRIQDVLGHSSPVITKTIYVEATKQVQRDAVDRLGFLFDA